MRWVLLSSILWYAGSDRPAESGGCTSFFALRAKEDTTEGGLCLQSKRGLAELERKCRRLGFCVLVSLARLRVKFANGFINFLLKSAIPCRAVLGGLFFSVFLVGASRLVLCH